MPLTRTIFDKTMHILEGPGTQAERLKRACVSELIPMNPEVPDFPAEIREQFGQLMQDLKHLSEMNDSQVADAVLRIQTMAAIARAHE